MADTILEEVQNIIKMITMFAGGCIYISIWAYLIKNWDRFVQTEYLYPCWEKVVSNLYTLWLIIHGMAVLALIMWAWGVL